jgi:hypothetical protein
LLAVLVFRQLSINTRNPLKVYGRWISKAEDDRMSKLAMITVILLFVGIGLAHSSCTIPGAIEKPACPWIGPELANNNTNNRNYFCLNTTGCPMNQKCNTNGTGTCTVPNIENYTRVCACQNNTICYLNNCTFDNCTCPELGANNNSSDISCARNGPCPINGTIDQITSTKEKKNGRVFTMTLNCPRCT